MPRRRCRVPFDSVASSAQSTSKSPIRLEPTLLGELADLGMVARMMHPMRICACPIYEYVSDCHSHIDTLMLYAMLHSDGGRTEGRDDAYPLQRQTLLRSALHYPHKAAIWAQQQPPLPCGSLASTSVPALSDSHFFLPPARPSSA